jgi:hypothetical protein
MHTGEPEVHEIAAVTQLDSVQGWPPVVQAVMQLPLPLQIMPDPQGVPGGAGLPWVQTGAPEAHEVLPR